MAIVVSQSSLVNMPSDWWPTSGGGGGVTLYDKYTYDYAYIWQTQPNVRTCVDFLARNIAQLGLHVYRRTDDDNRERLRDYPLAKVLSRPLPPEYKITTYKLIENYVSDLAIFANAYLLKLRMGKGMVGLLRVPPQFMTIKGGLVPTSYILNYNGEYREFSPDEIIHTHYYSSQSSVGGMSPLETLRRILAEEHAAGQYREGFWQNSARMNGIIERPKSSAKWSTEARERFKAEFEALYSGNNGSGKTAILEEDMTWKPNAFNPKESEYLEGRKLTREECARAYQIPPPLVGILDNATYSNISEQHKMLYTDVLGPIITQIEQDFVLQLLSEFRNTEGVYVEFNIEEKLKGDFETQSKSLQSAVGRPWMTANEARARMNLPLIEDPGADELVTPLNVLVGGQASPNDSAPDDNTDDNGDAAADALPKLKDMKVSVSANHPKLFEQHKTKWTRVLASFYRRQEASIMSKIPKAREKFVDIGILWDDERWNRELADDLKKLNLLTALEWANIIAKAFGEAVDEDQIIGWITEHSQRQAESMNEYTMLAVEAALRDPEPHSAVKDIFILASSVVAARQAISSVTNASNFGAQEGAKKSKLTTKTWVVTSGNPRDEHAAINGETVPIRGRFSNGMRWPGDSSGGAENNANCMCTLRFNKE